MGRIKLLLVDDHVVMRKGLRLLLESHPEFEVTGEASTGQEAVELTRQLEPSLILMDLSLPGMDGISAIKAIKEQNPAQKILALTMHDEAIYLEKALAAGANGFVLKRAADVELITAIWALERGEFFVDPGLQRYLVEKAFVREPSARRGERSTEAEQFKPEELTPREMDVLRLMALGYSNKEIAGKLFISAKTVENHKTRIKEKLAAKTRADLVRYAIERGLLER